jgi:hypothetical protein
MLLIQTEQEITKDFFVQLEDPFQLLNGLWGKLCLEKNVRAFLLLANGISEFAPSPNVNRRHFAAAGRYILAYFFDSLGDVCLLHLGVEDESELVVPHAKYLLSTGLPPVQAGSRKNKGQ